MTNEQIIDKLPYQPPFLFVDEITEVDQKGIKGNYTLQPEAHFYEGHFKNNPITPGVILTEIMAQIGLVCLGIFLFEDELVDSSIGVAMSSTAIEFYKYVLPGEKVYVVSEKEYFRFHKLKCKVTLYNEKDVLIARGIIAGMIKPWENE